MARPSRRWFLKAQDDLRAGNLDLTAWTMAKAASEAIPYTGTALKDK